MDVRTISLADEFGCIFPTPSPCSLGGHQNMDIRLLAIPDVMDERDLCADIIDITETAVEKNPGRKFSQQVFILEMVLSSRPVVQPEDEQDNEKGASP